MRFVSPLVMALVLGIALQVAGSAQEKDKKKETKKTANVFTDIAEAPIDYWVQGEYAGGGKLAAQVVARGNNKFDVYVLEGGLPGAGWDPKSKKVKIEAKLDPDTGIAAFTGNGFNKGSQIDAKAKTITLMPVEQAVIRLPRIERKSPKIGAKPPEGALILFDGKNADEWKEAKMTGDLLSVPNTSKRSFKDFKLHIEFRTPFQPTAGGQGRGNSGVYLLGREIQVLDSFGLKGDNNECGGLYGLRAPDVNMCYPPLMWQTYDVEFRAGKLDPNTKKQEAARITVMHNGVIIHDNVELKGAPAQGNIHLQNHGNPVVYRNIWILESK